jgi:phage tail-like protein
MGVNDETILSQAVELLQVPDFTGMPLRRVQSHLRASGHIFELRIRYQDSAGEPGQVLGQKPAAGAILPYGLATSIFEVTLSARSWLQYLPGLMADVAEREELEQYLFALQHEHNKAFLEIGDLALKLDPRTCPLELLGDLARFFGRPYLTDWPEAVIRRILLYRHQLDRWRGTLMGLRELLTCLIPGLGFDILDQSLTTPSRLDGDRLGVDSRVNENDPRAVIKIRLHGDLETFGRARLSCLGRVLDCEEIAGTRISLVFTQLKDKKGT